MALGWLWWRAWVPVNAVDSAAFCVAGVALGDINLHFAWQVWYVVTWTYALRGRRGTYGTGLALVAHLGPSWRRGRRTFGLAGMPLDDMDLHFARQVRYLVTWIITLRGVALMALGWLWWRAWAQLTPWMLWLFAWQIWNLAIWTFILHGKYDAWEHKHTLCVIGVALMALGWLW